MSSFRTVELSKPAYESQGLRYLTVKTENLRGRGDICLFVPETERRDLPIYLLLHGVYGSSWSWALSGGAHQTARRMMEMGEIAPAILAMPSDGLWGDGSSYTRHHGRSFDRWIVDDVVTAVRENIGAAAENEKLCIGGLSMGGYGALRLGALYGDRFAAISGHSSVTRLREIADFVEEDMGDLAERTPLPDIIDAVLDHRATLPAMRFDCGLEDELLDANRRLHAQLEGAGIAHTYEEFPGGHEWGYWATYLERTLRFFDAAV
ncbi:alpha/beta hydrolase family protein [Lewinella sp. 4G2]|uniref:alpha/beta hydrolase n=1 Tax=Lewinella sp. 4G2 TaxID=1803372 RepID=UPI0007B4F6E2|nr:alpha/beta hydrolase-fold protein [Lewinella sp. 4G2]OAV43611.1 acetyl esterase [Lewinella sp. 4G2]